MNEINPKELAEAFAEIEKFDLKPSTIICAICGHATHIHDKNSRFCAHLSGDFRRFAESIETDEKQKVYDLLKNQKPKLQFISHV